jgi:hypothetical protein
MHYNLNVGLALSVSNDLWAQGFFGRQRIVFIKIRRLFRNKMARKRLLIGKTNNDHTKKNPAKYKYRYSRRALLPPSLRSHDVD